MIEVNGLTKRYGDTLAVDHVSFTVQPGRVTGFLGPNGAGKSTTMRMMLGLDRPTAGKVTVNGLAYRDMPAPLRSVGALLDPKAIDGGRTAANHLLWMAHSNGIDRARIAHVLDLVGLSEVADRRVGTFSLGMNQRLGIAAAMLGDPDVLIFDEPINGLDPDGILWLRNILRWLAEEGRTVFLSSHLMSEIAKTAEHLIVIGKGRIIADASVDSLLAGHAAHDVLVRAERQSELSSHLVAHGGLVQPAEEGAIAVRGLDSRAIGAIAAANGVALIELTPRNASLEDAFLELTHESTDYQSAELVAHAQGA